MIVVDFVCTEQEYGSHVRQRHWERLGHCPLCGEEDYLIGHGYYLRKPKGMLSGKGTGMIWIKRWLCKLCHRTILVLPDFLLIFRIM